MRLGFGDSRWKNRADTAANADAEDSVSGGLTAGSAWSKPSAMIPDMMPLYDAEQFEGLLQRERARADRAAARPPRDLPQRRTEAKKGPGGSTVDPVWGATTDNKQFSLVIFRPRTRTDRSGLVELLQTSIRTTDAVGVVDNRRLGVLLPDTSAENAIFFVKKVLAGAELASVNLSHVVHTYPDSWPDSGSSNWDEPRRGDQTGSHQTGSHQTGSDHSNDGQAGPPAGNSTPPTQQRSTTDVRELATHARAGDSSLLRTVIGWLQTTASRRVNRAPLQA